MLQDNFTVAELQAHYRAVRARLNPPPAPAMPPTPLPVLYARARLSGLAMRPPKAERPCRLRDEEFSTPLPMSARDILREVARDHGVRLYDLCRPGVYRGAAMVRARHEAAYRLRAERGFTYPQIAKFMGGFDHTTVLHGVRRHCSRFDLPFPKRIPA